MDYDTIKIAILKDGSIRVSTDEVSAPNHGNAEQLLELIAKKAGGPTKIEQKGGHAHSHNHLHEGDHHHH
jgi:hypothetical protein